MTISTETRSRTAICPNCCVEGRFYGRLMIGEVFECGSCGTQLEVACTAPLVLEALAKVEEDEGDFLW